MSTRTANDDAADAAQRVARDAYGRLLASLCSESRDVAAAEDALGDAFERALSHWPQEGVPDEPVGWLLTAARRRLVDGARHRAVVRQGAEKLVPLLETTSREAMNTDRRVDLMLICAHPDIDARVHAPLMLQTVLGLTAQQMASAFALGPAALGQRLARAKRAIKAQALPFALPGDVTETRIAPALDAIYTAFGTGWDDASGARDLRHGLAGEALWLGRMLAQRFDDHAEAHGLVALMLFAQSRRDARRTDDGRFVPFSEQDPANWDQRMIEQAEVRLARAAGLGAMGRFQLEAAIQAQYARPPANVEAVALLYEGLVRIAPSRASMIGRAAALGRARGAATGLGALAHLRSKDVNGDASYWAVKAHLHFEADQWAAAADAWQCAIGLTEDPAVRSWLGERRREAQRRITDQ